jgi:hypothetical protein
MTEVRCHCPGSTTIDVEDIGTGTVYLGAAIHGAGGVVVSEERMRQHLLMARKRGLDLWVYTRLTAQDEEKVRVALWKLVEPPPPPAPEQLDLGIGGRR